MTGRRQALAVIALGLGIAAAAQAAAPLATPPLYDGVVVTEPYIYVNPPSGKPGGAKGASAVLSMDAHASPVVALATPEQPPQAQVVAQGGSLVLPPSATAIHVSIKPLDPAAVGAPPSPDVVLGNVYRITIVDQAGSPATAPPSALVTIVLRTPEPGVEATMAQRVGGTWRPLKSEPGPGFVVAVVTSFGDFAVTSPSSTSPGAGSPPPSTGPSSIPKEGPPGSAPGAGERGVGAVVILLLLAFIVMASLATARRRRNRRR